MSDILAANGIVELAASNFDVVNLTPMVTGLSAGSGSPGSALTIIGQNFSGAAGNLSVFFGTNVVPPVSVLGDTLITVTVPNGSGTVDVKVQSGTNETDTVSSNPNANVNAPIFGYGTSALTAADKFTFVVLKSPTIQHVGMSGANLVMSGTNNSGSGGTYHVLTSTNIAVRLTNWTVLTNGSFDGNGNFSFTNGIGATNAQLFYVLQVP
jgi:hypothetical protein